MSLPKAVVRKRRENVGQPRSHPLKSVRRRSTITICGRIFFLFEALHIPHANAEEQFFPSVECEGCMPQGHSVRSVCKLLVARHRFEKGRAREPMQLTCLAVDEERPDPQ